MPFKLRFEDLAPLSAYAVLERVNGGEKRRLGDLRVYDLLFGDDGRPIYKGVYLFYSSGGACLYVGKNSAQKFVERIPWHLSLSPRSWMNHLLKRTRQYEHLASLEEAAEVAREDTLLLIDVGQHEQIRPLENFFRLFAAPRYNSYRESRRKRYTAMKLGAPLIEVLGQL